MKTDLNELQQHAELHVYDGLEDEPCVGENFLIPGPTGEIEALLATPGNGAEVQAIAVICHPHPLYGGSMANKVVHIIANTFNELGLVTLRFNFRGVGHSRGRFDQGKGEVEDLTAVVKWLRARHPDKPLWLAGFSFGSFVAFQAQAELQVERLLLVAPPVSMFEFVALPAPAVPWIVIQGGKDDVVIPEKVSTWVSKQPSPPRYLWFSDADHFFHGRLASIRDAIKEEWAD